MEQAHWNEHFFQQKTPSKKTGYYHSIRICRLDRSAFFDGLCGVCLLTAQPVNNGNKGEYDANPVETIRHGVNHVFKRPLEAVGYRLKDALKVHG